MESSILKVCVCVFFSFSFFFSASYFSLRGNHCCTFLNSVMSTFSHMVYINSMKQKGLPLISNKAAHCTVLSHSLVDSAPHVYQQAQIRTDRGITYNRAPHIWHKSHPATVLHCCLLHPICLHDLVEPTRKCVFFKGSGPLLIHKMTSV